MTERMTYGQVERALSALGFKRVPNEQYFVMRHTKRDAILALANGEPTTVVRPAYRLAVHHAVVGMGVATEAQYNNALERARVRHRRVVVRPRLPGSGVLSAKQNEVGAVTAA